MNIRNTQHADISALQKVLEGTELFPPEMLPDMLHDYLNGNAQGAFWFTIERDQLPIGFAYIMPEALTDKTYNLLAIAILPELQGIGNGRLLLKHIEETLKAHQARILIIDTSGTDAFEATRNFYLKNNYVEEACIRDFWAKGDDKVIFWKSL